MDLGNSLSQSARTTTAGDSPHQPSPPQLIVPPEEDCLSHESAAFHTPVSELSPSSSNDGEAVKTSGEWVGKASHITTGFNKRFSDSAEMSDLDVSKRTHSQQSFSSTNSLTTSKELVPGKTTPSSAMSEMTAVAEIPTRTRSESPLPVSSTHTKDSRITESFHGASWADQTSTTSETRIAYQHLKILEESQAAGYGQFDNESPLESSTTELLGNEGNTVTKKYHPLPRHLVTNGHASPELYHSPIGGPRMKYYNTLILLSIIVA